MSSFLSAFLRSLVQIGGGALGVGPILVNGTVTPETAAGLVFAVGGLVLAQVRASKTEKLKTAVDATPSLPSAKEVESGKLT